MASARRITVEFLGNNRSLDNAMDTSARKGSKFGSALGKVAKVGALGLAAGVAIAGKALFDMTKAAAADEAAQVRLAQTLKNTTGANAAQVASVEDWIAKQGIALGVTDDELRPAMEKLVVATGDVAKAQKLASLAMDIAAGRGISLEAASKALARAQNGQLDGLSRLGIATKNAAGETLTFEQLTNRLGNTFEGQAAKKANTFQGKMDRLKLVFNETKEEIGAKLLPMVTRLATWFLNEGLPAIQRFGAYLQNTLPPIFEKVKAVVSRVMGALRGDTGGAMADIRSTIANAISIIQSLWDRFGKNILQFVRSAFTAIKEVIGGALKIISGIVQVFSSALKGDWRGVWEGIKKILRGAWSVIKGIVRFGLAALRMAFKNGWEAIKGVAGKAWEGIKNLVANRVQGMVAAVKAIPGKIKALAGLYRAATAIVLQRLISGLGDFGRAALGKIVDAVRGIPGKVRALAGSFKNAASHIMGQLVAGFKGAGGLVSDIAGNVWDAVRGLLNSAIGKLRSALNFTIGIPGPDIHVNVGSSIPYLAKGTNFHKGGLAVVGEEGPELVNLPRGSKVTPHGQSMGAMRSMAGAGAPIIININMGVGDPVAVGREIEKIARRFTATTGRPLVLA